MKTAASPGPAEPTARRLRWLPAVAVAAALAPLLFGWRQFAQLHWFGDDFFLLDQIAQMGFGRWVGVVFAENFAPFFKLAWGAVLFGADGDYRAMIAALWLTHALNTVLLGRALERAEFPSLAVVGTVVAFGVSPLHIESLGWSVQWSAVLATTFLLGALVRLQRPGPATWRDHLVLAACSAGAATSFSRGVLVGGIGAVGLLLRAAGEGRGFRGRTLAGAVVVLLPALGAFAVILTASDGNHRDLAGQGAAVARFAATYLLLNPVLPLLGEADPGTAGIVGAAALKLTVVGAGLALARGRARTLLLLLVVHELGNALLLGVGRHHTGFAAALSSRYNYSALLATLPFLWLVVDALRARLASSGPRLAGACAAAALAAAPLHAAAAWPAQLAEFVSWRGVDLRRLMAAPPSTDPADRVPALDFMHVERAKALGRTFHLR